MSRDGLAGFLYGGKCRALRLAVERAATTRSSITFTMALVSEGWTVDDLFLEPHGVRAGARVKKL
jgi:hypothetical protein